MCNRCNSNASYSNSSCGCGCNCGCNTCCGNGWGNFWDSGYQSICRDCSGNIRVNNCGRCGSQRNSGCLYALSETAQTTNTASCGYANNAANTASCGYANNAANTASASGCGGCGYSRQYGLTPTSCCFGSTFGSCGSARRRSRSGYGCGYGYGYGYDIEDSDD